MSWRDAWFYDAGYNDGKEDSGGSFKLRPGCGTALGIALFAVFFYFLLFR